MAGLSRRAFLGTVTALAAGWGLARGQLGAALAAPLTPSDAQTTLLQTIRLGGRGAREYRTLVAASGEPYVTRLDLLGKEASPARTSARRSLLYMGHLSDIHVMDAKSPARFEAMAGQSHSLWAGACRPQDTLTVHVQAAMVEAMSGARYSPLTGAPMAAAVVTGDSADMMSDLETRWYIDTLDGLPVTPCSATPGVYDGVQNWEGTTYAYHPDDPSGDIFGDYGFPAFPGMLEAAVSTSTDPLPIPVPWYTVYGNHDATYFGTVPVSPAMRSWAVGDRKASQWEPLAVNFLGGWTSDASAFQRFFHAVTSNLGFRQGIRSVASDPDRRLLEQGDFMKAHFQTQPVPGPVGHGFTQSNLDTGESWWAADFGPFVRCFGLNTCNLTAGPDGAVPADQFDWLKEQLTQAQAENKLAIVLSHHNSLTLENDAHPVVNPGQKLYHADEFIAMLNEFPNLVAWLNGHTHINTITAHPREGGGGFWEITTASCIDFPQQQQLVEIVDNRDGTMSIFTTVLDHASPAVFSGDFTTTGLASLSRELAVNDWIENPTMRLGSPTDRNCELLLPAPFDLSGISDAALEKAQAEQRARLVAYEEALPR